MPIIGSFGAGSGSGFGQRQASGPKYVEATGGTEFTVGDYKIHVFTGDGTLCVTSQGKDSGNNKINYMVVAGGGGGGAGTGGGGGAGGFRESRDPASAPIWTASPLASTTALTCIGTGAIPITVGAGGTKAVSPGGIPADRGSDSIFSTITSTGGGGGGGGGGQPYMPGGSGGGASRLGSPGGIGNTPPVSPPQGNNGNNGPNLEGAGGGGAGGVGPSKGNAGQGVATAIGPAAYGDCVSCSTYFSGGGGGGSDQNPGIGGQGGTGGDGGGGRGGCRQGSFPPAGEPGDPNTGGGGGARGLCPHGPGNDGGSGIVIIRYKFQN